MIKKILTLCFLGFAIVCPRLYAESVTALLQQARELQKEGKYLESQQVYENLLAEAATANQAEILKARDEYEVLNFKFLTSRLQMPGSEFYTVVPGDSLYKIARKYNTTIDLIKKMNGLSGDVIYPDMKLKVIKGTFSVWVDKTNNVMMLYLDQKPIKRYSVATGASDSVTPAGQFEIVNKLKDPTWYKAGAIVPPDSPENLLGTRWLGFDHKGYGIHGTTEPDTIGQHVTSGCVRMKNEEVEEIYSFLPTGTKVIIVD